MADLGALDGDVSVARDVNEAGQIVGWSTIESGDPHAVLWESGNIIDLGTLGGAESRAHAINQSGVIVGDALDQDGLRHAVQWVDGQIEELGTLDGDESIAIDINDAGQVVGASSTSPSVRLAGGSGTHAVLWDNRTIKDLGTIGGGDYSFAYGVNEGGQVVGELASRPGADSGRDGQHAFVWAWGTITDLGTLEDHEARRTTSTTAVKLLAWHLRMALAEARRSGQEMESFGSRAETVWRPVRTISMTRDKSSDIRRQITVILLKPEPTRCCGSLARVRVSSSHGPAMPYRRRWPQPRRSRPLGKPMWLSSSVTFTSSPTPSPSPRIPKSNPPHKCRRRPAQLQHRRPQYQRRPRGGREHNDYGVCAGGRIRVPLQHSRTHGSRSGWQAHRHR